MYTTAYDRLAGWVFFALGIVGVFTDHIGSYILLSPWETGLYLGLGLLGMAAARSRHRVAALGALALGMVTFMWGIWDMAWPVSFLGTAEPLETVIHIVAGLWGMYVAVHDVNVWRQATTS
ncbi:hypothetical protein JI721_11845 [Alicyclobacillus cycloheptanicus]|uniref:DUF4383 domain-containing protein n=1 Tax=Alicyclobacillus cycloheptanicus TaxID=1457 RepID=A0ABT9XG10_9BACL|nr:hypothetical protein [Alicyclobacillus cycloheptanicus]MDQ0189232.1 hypothetical protein [Alicyclobacillus cycloheptanicus]WDM00416.1 hypothetical protein JI721_11845 [Alicyclobacillus cycloheptanicus]